MAFGRKSQLQVRYEYLLAASVDAVNKARKAGVNLISLETELETVYYSNPNDLDGMGYTRPAPPDVNVEIQD